MTTNYVRKVANDETATMLERWTKGETLDSIGASYGITRERVRQRLAPLITPGMRAARPTQTSRTRDRVLAWVADHPYAGASECAEALGLTTTCVTDYHTFRYVKRYAQPMDKHSREDCVAAIRRVGTGSAAEYDRLRAPGDPSSVLVANHYNSWREVCLDAGVTPAAPIRNSYTRSVPRGEAAFDALVEGAAAWLASDPSHLSWAAFAVWYNVNVRPVSGFSSNSLRSYSRGRRWVEIRDAAIRLATKASDVVESS